jgi:sugar-specific transcriptional regulator TrmB
LSEIEDNAVHLLNSLGITFLQAKVYFTLAKSGKLTIKAILKASEVDRSDLYGTLAELQKIRLVEKLETTPAEFKAIPMEEAISALIQLRNKKTIDLQQQTIELIQQKKKKSVSDQKDEVSEFTIIKDPQGRLFKSETVVEMTQESIWVVTKWGFLESFIQNANKQILQALKRGVKILVVTEKPEHQDSLPQQVQTLMKNSGFQIKYISFLPAVILTLFDNKKVTIAVSNSKNLDQTLFSWSNNPSLIELSQNYFERMWTSA